MGSEKNTAPMKVCDTELESVSGGAMGAGTGASGSFTSNTGTQLNLLVSWSVQSDSFGRKTLAVDVYASSYSLYCNPSLSGVELTVNGMSYSSGTPAISYGGRTAVTNKLASFSVPNVSGTVTLSAVWHFNGVYSGTSLGDIRASGTITV